MRIRNQCRSCGLPYGARLDHDTATLLCPNCGDSQTVDPTAWAARTDDRTIERCALCGCRHLYRQRDFNRALGCLLVAIGAILVPWTYGLSLVVLAAIDLLLYYRLRQVVVCYRCDTVYRDARPTSRQKDFDLLKHDVLKYGKSWQELPAEELADGQQTGSASAATQRMALDDAVEHRGEGVKGGH